LICSYCFNKLAFALFTSSSVTGISLKPSKTDNKVVSASNNDLSEGTSTLKYIKEGSFVNGEWDHTEAAFLPSINALYNLPEGWLVKISSATVMAAKSS